MNESSPIRTETARAYEPGPIQAPVRTRRRFRPIRWLVLLVALAAIGAVAHRWYDSRTQKGTEQAAGAAGGRHGGKRGGSDLPQAVGIAPITTGDMPVVLQGLGTVTPLATVTVKSQISGYLTEVKFREGQMVKAGDPSPRSIRAPTRRCSRSIRGSSPAIRRCSRTRSSISSATRP